MTGSVNMFNIGKSGLMVTKQALATTGHNISNVNTEGYSRQQVEQTAGPQVIDGGRISIGTGVWSKQVSRMNDEYLDRRLSTESKNLANVEEKDLYLKQTEQVFNESNADGINRLATKFFNEFRTLSNDPGNTAIRASVRESSSQLAHDFNRVDRELKDLANNIDVRIEGHVRDFNALTKEVRDLNLMIERTEAANGGTAPDLYDKRDLALKKLGALAEISTSKDNNGRFTVTLAGHVAVVTGGDVTEISTLRTPSDPQTGKKYGHLDIVVNEPVPTKLTDKIKGGRLGGLIETRDKDIGAAQDKIDEIAYHISKEVNNIHRQGFGLDGGTNRDFFEEPLQMEGAAEHMRLAKNVVDSLDSIAAAKEAGGPSDNRIALAISGVGGLKGIGDEPNASILDMYNSMVNNLAVKTDANQKTLTFQEDVVTQLNSVRDALVGVSLDEETSNLVRFQHAYAASAKVLQVADELTQTVLNTFK